jgi:8-amino-7-oxononanoate synthase
MQVNGRSCLCFVNNDYLGLANHPAAILAAQRALDEFGVGAGASALISGHSSLMEELESNLAQWQGQRKALHFSSGYMANVGILQALVDENTAVFSDQLNHASLIDGLRLTRAAERYIYGHGNVLELEQQLQNSRASQKVIVTDAVFSMDGDLAPLRQLAQLADQYDALLVVDDAHGVGVLGHEGRGSLDHLGVASERIIYMATLGKALGVSGAFVSASDVWMEWLLQRCRTYIFTTGTPPALAAAVLANLQVCRQESWRRQRLEELGQRLSAGLSRLQATTLPSQSAIHALVVGGNQAALELSGALWEKGIWVPAIRPPTVAEGSARLRISLSALHEPGHVDELLQALESVL